ncbi:MAG: adenine nucleotide alpha hydrolase [Flavobacteriales bacterium]|nr:adenine nucleotide alpha hydrolase [Flavobacteriales bacterium]MCX7769326.1 adenine nucleotide alpha hydrolase [Flavobacteriales bacterium]MDW8410733.1 ATP-binding protein [Flavobacteriales bacterium]
MRPILLSWSGGKDSALALWRLLQSGQWKPVGLLCTFSTPFDRVLMHGVRRLLLLQQAQATGIDLVPIFLPPEPSNDVYETAWAEVVGDWCRRGVRHVAFGDVFLQDIRAYREKQLAKLDMEPVFPVWTGCPEREASWQLLEEFWSVGFRTRIVCVELTKLGEEWAGRELSPTQARRLPPDVDPCGENGEFHTFVFAGPCFKNPIRVRLGKRFFAKGFCYRDLLPA